jgi:hypothetical protein
VFSKNVIASATMALVIAACIFSASAQWAPMKTEINMGPLKLLSGAVDSTALEASIPATNNATLNNTDINLTLINNSTSELPADEVIDLSGYSEDRLSGNLTGYTNIMYPIAESSGFTTSTASGGGGCGCG